MRLAHLPLLLLALRLAAGEVPVLTRHETASLGYDLAATSPWMPILWDRCTLQMPAATDSVVVTARLLSGIGIAADGTDLLLLRDGHRLTLTADQLTITGLSEEWHGAWRGDGSLATPLTITLPAGIDAAGVLLACRQICYANLGGVRSIAPRTISIVVTRDGTAGAPLEIGVIPGASAPPPMLRLDDIEMPMDAVVDLRHQGWYDSRAMASDLIWWRTGPLWGTRIDGANGELGLDPHGLDAFITDQLRLSASQMGEFGLTFQCSANGYAGRNLVMAVRVKAPQNALQVVGDFPLTVTGGADIPFLLSDPNITLSGCIEHPSQGSQAIDNPFTSSKDGDRLNLLLNAPPGPAWISGCAVFSNGSATYRLPYRILNLTPPEETN